MTCLRRSTYWTQCSCCSSCSRMGVTLRHKCRGLNSTSRNWYNCCSCAGRRPSMFSFNYKSEKKKKRSNSKQTKREMRGQYSHCGVLLHIAWQQELKCNMDISLWVMRCSQHSLLLAGTQPNETKTITCPFTSPSHTYTHMLGRINTPPRPVLTWIHIDCTIQIKLFESTHTNNIH